MQKLYDGPIPPELDSELVALIQEGRTIDAVKRLRTATGASLGEGLTWVNERLKKLSGVPWKGKPCPYWGKPLSTDQARQCFECGRDWHDQA